jgi:hypothetical protein
VEEGLDSFISHRPAVPNLERIREAGLPAFLQEQRERRLLVENLLAGFNDGRSMSFYCRATALMPLELVRQAINEVQEATRSGQLESSDRRARAKAMRGAIQALALLVGTDLKLRRAKK